MKTWLSWVILGVIGLVAVCLLGYCVFGWKDGGSSPDRSLNAQPTTLATNSLDTMRMVIRSRSGKSRTDAGSARRQYRVPKGAVLVRAMFEDLPEPERKLCETLQEALDAEDLDKTLTAATEAMSSKNSEVRSHVVDALCWFGADALPELTVLMGDKDEDVAQSAINAWETALSEIDDPEMRINIAGLALKAVYDRDARTYIGSQFSNAATEFIDAQEDEESALEARLKVVETVVEMIDSTDGSLSDVGQDVYEEITGHKWISEDEAVQYLDDPDNYEPPEDREQDFADAEEGEEEPKSAPDVEASPEAETELETKTEAESKTEVEADSEAGVDSGQETVFPQTDSEQ